MISGVPQEISIGTNFVHFISQWSGKKAMQPRDSTHFGSCVGREWQAIKNNRSHSQIQKDLSKTLTDKELSF